ncbi:hypothetical protein POI8812_00452 [Pontivivens insulae]|uniref:O-antigen ligase-related domain-containing protein n=2 Tax=Pontivivens insulae TaxID=1639689 RepID=A0A2R8A7E5_9RHOB|nr:O-antigen ligase-like membrane protein [Pontivivens insulae]SPF28154.1 hypothetical protein POI8812_00452 [Pontivivens insulae]
MPDAFSLLVAGLCITAPISSKAGPILLLIVLGYVVITGQYKLVRLSPMPPFLGLALGIAATHVLVPYLNPLGTGLITEPFRFGTVILAGWVLVAAPAIPATDRGLTLLTGLHILSGVAIIALPVLHEGFAGFERVNQSAIVHLFSGAAIAIRLFRDGVQSKPLVLVILFSSGVVCFASDSQSAQLAYLLCLLVTGFAGVAFRYVATGIFLLTALFAFSAPWLAANGSSIFVDSGFLQTELSHAMSATHRIGIWVSSAELVKEGLPWGWGVEGTPDARMIIEGYPIPWTHPHNFFLEMWLGVGFFAVPLFGALAIVAYRNVVNFGRGRALLLGFVVAALALSSVGHSFWQGWWQATLVITFGFATRPAKYADWSSTRGRMATKSEPA